MYNITVVFTLWCVFKVRWKRIEISSLPTSSVPVSSQLPWWSSLERLETKKLLHVQLEEQGL